MASRPTKAKVMVLFTAALCCAATVTPFTSSGATYPDLESSAIVEIKKQLDEALQKQIKGASKQKGGMTKSKQKALEGKK